MRISEFAKLSGTPVDTLRYYDKIGLLIPAKANQQRVYTVEDLLKLKSIIKLKNLNFSLDEIASILALDAQIDAGLAVGVAEKALALESQNMLQVKYEEVLQREREILEIKGQLEHLLNKLDQFINES